jgi:hypothetical protein
MCPAPASSASPRVFFGSGHMLTGARYSLLRSLHASWMQDDSKWSSDQSTRQTRRPYCARPRALSACMHMYRRHFPTQALLGIAPQVWAVHRARSGSAPYDDSCSSNIETVHLSLEGHVAEIPHEQRSADSPYFGRTVSTTGSIQQC